MGADSSTIAHKETLTNFEKQQPDHIFVKAGKDAFAILVPITNNPYTADPYKTLWEKGYRRAKRDYDYARLAAQRKEEEEGVSTSGSSSVKPSTGNRPLPNRLRPRTPGTQTTQAAQTPQAPVSRPVQIARSRTYRSGTIGDHLAAAVTPAKPIGAR